MASLGHDELTHWSEGIEVVGPGLGMFLENLDSPTVFLHSPYGRQLQGDCQWPLKIVEIPTVHVSPQSIVTEAVPTYIKPTNHTDDLQNLASYDLNCELLATIYHPQLCSM